MKIGLYPGTFDPITNGHLDLVKRSMNFCDQLIILIGVNSAKKTLFSIEERISLIKKSLVTNINFLNRTNINVTSYNGLIVDYARDNNVSIMIRGIRSVSDFEYEINLANINKALIPYIDTVFLPTASELAVVSSGMVKEIAKHKGNIDQFVPTVVAEALYKKIGQI